MLEFKGAYSYCLTANAIIGVWILLGRMFQWNCGDREPSWFNKKDTNESIYVILERIGHRVNQNVAGYN